MNMVLASDVAKWLTRLARAHGVPLDRPKWGVDLERTSTGTVCVLVNSVNSVKLTFDAVVAGEQRLAHEDAYVVAAMRAQAGIPPAGRNRPVLAQTQEALSV